MELGKRARIVIICMAAALLTAGLYLRFGGPAASPYGPVAEELTRRGYTLADEDFYNAGSFPDTSIAAVLAGQELSAAVEASRQGGFPADVNAVGDITALLLTMENQDIITIFTRDGAIELCFVQRLGEEGLRPLS